MNNLSPNGGRGPSGRTYCAVSLPSDPWTSFLSWLQPYEAPCRPDTINPRRKSCLQPRLGDTMTETPCGAHPHLTDLPDSYRVCFTATLCRVQYPQLPHCFPFDSKQSGSLQYQFCWQETTVVMWPRNAERQIFRNGLRFEAIISSIMRVLSDAVIRSVHTDLYVEMVRYSTWRSREIVQILSTPTPVSERPSERCGF